MKQVFALFVLAVIGAAPVVACTFCAGNISQQQSLGERLKSSPFVARGTLKNPKVDPSGVGGTTEFHLNKVLKGSEPGLAPTLIIPQYLPIVGDTPTDYLIFSSLRKGQPDSPFGLPASDALIDYLTQLQQLDTKDAATRLGWAYRNLDSADAGIAADAFLMFAKASDAEIVQAKGAFDPVKVRRLLVHPRTPVERLGVFALVLGLTGGKAEAKLFNELLDAQPMSERVTANFGGYLAATIVADPEAGWTRLDKLIDDASLTYERRFALVGTIRFFQNTRPEEARTRILASYRKLIVQGDCADLVIDDLRRWGWWDLTSDILSQWGKPTHSSPIVKRGIVRYALCAPDKKSAEFVVMARQQEPKLVAQVEETLKLFEPVKPK
jgi:hypothetical protein